jgi:hypothetical protein
VALVAVLVLHYCLRTVQRLQAASHFATLVTSAFVVAVYQRFSQEPPLVLASRLIEAALRDTRGRWLLLLSVSFGVGLTLYFRWFTEEEEDARARGWAAAAVNGQGNLRRLLRGWGLYMLLNSCPNPDYGAVVLALFLSWEYLFYGAKRVHMAINREQGMRRYMANPPPRRGAGAEQYTAAQLEKLKRSVERDQSLLHQVSDAGRTAWGRFSTGGPHVLHATEEERGAPPRGSCAIM